MEHFTPIQSLVGGMLIGLSAAIVLVTQGRIAGVSGMCGAALSLGSEGRGWRLAFLAGLLGVGVVGAPLYPALFSTAAVPSLGMVALAGVLVGFGTRLGNGCTSGHGVCGISRMSPRSIAATVTFISTGAATVYIMRHLLGGGA